MSKKSQASTEYLITVGLSLLLITPLFILYMTHSQSSKDQIIIEQIDNIEKQIIYASEKIYYHGKLSKTTLRINFPDNIDDIIISEKEINFKMKTSRGITEIEKKSNIPLTGTINTNKGIKDIVIESRGDVVWISG